MASKTLPTKVNPTSVLHTSLSSSPPLITSAKGNHLYPSTGPPIFDASGGAAVSCIGHAHPRMLHAISAQLSKTEYTFSPHFSTPAYEALAQFLVDSTGGVMSKVFVTGSGSEAIEAAVKMARQYFVELEGGNTQRTRFIVRDRSYHGNTLGSLGVSGHAARRRIYEPLLMDTVSFVAPCYAYRDLRAQESEEAYVRRLAQELDEEFTRLPCKSVAAVILETMAGVTLGAVAPPPGYLAAMKTVCERHGALFILDEVLCGMGRTGTLHAWQQEGVRPDLQTVAKGLGAGYAPIGALLVGRKVVRVLERGTGGFVHFQTYHGHAVSCAAALEVQSIVRDDKLLLNCRRMGLLLGERLRWRLGRHGNVGDIRGRGLVWAIELVASKATKAPFPVTDKIAPRIHAKGLQDFGIALMPGGGVADGINGDLIILAPAYNITKEDVELMVDLTAKAIENVLGATDEMNKVIEPELLELYRTMVEKDVDKQM
ncbi:similar to class III aminotransferase [Plenodomus lingam JN3]|uniref:Similar to class III aminotransferase n=1 Tax=Leptosphaeria maculans (strain JN3 / isolate v23.1.3 / race Av1-4-5-6-7-8) TaxID=985895 RepID=E5AA28_LEPMJ|nr:similar to class III aminotransferase [Plenodomus lingam JN3]CBY00519.1 similar to class III aminotransferase [Plenodomus lingam JN3]